MRPLLPLLASLFSLESIDDCYSYHPINSSNSLVPFYCLCGFSPSLFKDLGPEFSLFLYSSNSAIDLDIIVHMNDPPNMVTCSNGHLTLTPFSPMAFSSCYLSHKIPTVKSWTFHIWNCSVSKVILSIIPSLVTNLNREWMHSFSPFSLPAGWNGALSLTMK